MQKNNTLNQSSDYRVAPSQGGPQRIGANPNPQMMKVTMPAGKKRTQPSLIKKVIKRSLFKKALPYVIVGGSTGLGIEWGLGLIF